MFSQVLRKPEFREVNDRYQNTIGKWEYKNGRKHHGKNGISM